MSIIINAKQFRRGLVGLMAASMLGLAGCGGSENTSQPVRQSVVLPEGNTPAQIASASADDYDDNVYGLITGSTLAGWVNDWAANKPAGINGKLVILQTNADESYIAPDNANVFTYSVASSEWTETRSNGVVVTKSMVPSGPVMDAFLEKYDIDPSNDMVVCAMGKPGTGQAMQAGRCWYMFRYWGVPKGRLAMLNGGNNWNQTNNALPLSATGSVPPYTGTATVKDLPQINFALQATLEDMIDSVPETDTNILNDGIFIWDARSANQYDPVSDGVDDGDNDFQSGPVQGHPNGALDLDFSNLLDSTQGYSYKPKATLASYLNGDDVGGVSFIDSTLGGVGSGNAYQDGDVIITYCETTFRAMITGFATAAILGKPTRFYDGAMTEWHSLSAVRDSNGNLLLPTDSPWRTDIVTRSYSFAKSVPVAPPADANSSGYITDAYANTANAIIIEDLAYKGIGVDVGAGSSSGSSSGGGGLPANPCGG